MCTKDQALEKMYGPAKQVCGTLLLSKQTKVLLQTLIWYPFMSADAFCSKTFFSPEGLQQNKHKYVRQDKELFTYEGNCD